MPQLMLNKRDFIFISAFMTSAPAQAEISDISTAIIPDCSGKLFATLLMLMAIFAFAWQLYVPEPMTFSLDVLNYTHE